MKNLGIGEKYMFYNNYEINLDDNHSKLEEFKPKFSKDHVDLYKLQNGIELNISAIVGKNGSGKSSIIELLFYVIYKLANDKKIVQKSTQILEDKLYHLESFVSYHSEELQKSSSQLKKEILKINGYSNSAGFYYDFVRALDIEKNRSFKYLTRREIDDFLTHTLSKKISVLRAQLINEQELNDVLNRELNVIVLFGLNKELFELKIDKGQFTLTTWSENGSAKTEVSDFKLESLFYTVAINYSHHSLNSKIMGSWLDSLFHKNDGYKTPLVINPMRTDGNFEINEEEGFAKARLLSNLISARLTNFNDRQFLLNERQNIIALKFQLKKRVKEKVLISWDSLSDTSTSSGQIIDGFLLKELGVEIKQIKNIPYSKELADYFVEKFWKTVYTYDGYNQIPREGKPLSVYVNDIYEYFKNDNSHITFKIKQVINYFKHRLEFQEDQWNESEQGHFLTISNLIKFCRISVVGNYQKIIENLLPAIFEMDFFFETELDEEEFVKKYEHNFEGLAEVPRFGKLSSGEKQLIHSVQTLVYHLSNLNSIDGSVFGRIQYENINVIFDEIELYFHPDLQRKFIKYLHDSLERLKLTKTKRINIIFATHSPFILSDIPSSNILRLKDGKPRYQQNKTFASNLYDLLADDFFLESGVIGEFAENKIRSIIEQFDSEGTGLDIIELIGDEFLRGVAKDKVLSKIIQKEILVKERDELQRKIDNL